MTVTAGARATTRVSLPWDVRNMEAFLMSTTVISTAQRLTLTKDERQLERAHRNSVLQKRIHEGELEMSRWQLLAARNTAHRLRIVASAGAGKTRTLANAIAAAATLQG